MKSYTYRDHSIQPKRDFGRHGYLADGKIVTKGWVVCKDGVNIMPGGTWFQSLREARSALDVFLRVRGNADRFWEIMQPFPYKRVGQRVVERDCTVECGRFKAVIKNHRVFSLTRQPRTRV
jgi:hypothetical protein